MNGSNTLWIGSHWKIITRLTESHHAIVMAPRVILPIFMRWVGKIRRYMNKMLSLTIDMIVTYASWPAK